MPRLKSRQFQIPNGLVMYDSQSRWKSREWSTFDEIVDELMAYRMAHKETYIRAGKALDRDGIAAEVDEYNANLCVRMGWKHLVDPGEADPGPKAPARLTAGVQKLVAAAAGVAKLAKGYKALKDWKASQDPPVPQEMGESRALICSQCPMNQPGNFTDFFTIPLSEAIRKDIEEANQRGLKTTADDKLYVCKACMCPLAVKVWAPIQYIAGAMTEEVKAELRKAPRCWIIDELARFT